MEDFYFLILEGFQREAINYNGYSFTVVGKSGNIVTKIRIEKSNKTNEEMLEEENKEEDNIENDDI